MTFSKLYPNARVNLDLVKYRGVAPTQATPLAAGLDLVATEDVHLPPGAVRDVGTGTRVAIPPGYVGLTRGRSGLAFKRKVWVFEGTIDADYRGELRVQLANVGLDGVVIRKGERIAQLVIVPCVHPVLEHVDDEALFVDTERGEKGFGSTGQ